MISIHALRVGSDPGGPGGAMPCLSFNPRSPCGERRCWAEFCGPGWSFNPRSPCGERLVRNRYSFSDFIFQSTLPVWGATCLEDHPIDRERISIHAPRVGSDHLSQQPRTGRSNFNPRSPCGERQQRCTNTASVCCAIRHILQKICSSLIILLHLQ